MAVPQPGRITEDRDGSGFDAAVIAIGCLVAIASALVRTFEQRQGMKVCCSEEIAFGGDLIDRARLKRVAQPMSKNRYGQYLIKIPTGEEPWH